MDFLTTARMLMDLREQHGPFHYSFDEENGTLTMEFRVESDVPRLFDDATRMFEPA